jgi:UPF0148 protein
MKREDDIMAGYLLKGGKMLSKSCPSCGCPLFEIKGETFCVVCREEETRRDSPPPAAAPLPATADQKLPAATELSFPSLAASLEETLVELCRRIREEQDPARVLLLANAVRSGVKALKQLR